MEELKETTQLALNVLRGRINKQDEEIKTLQTIEKNSRKRIEELEERLKRIEDLFAIADNGDIYLANNLIVDCGAAVLREIRETGKAA